MIKSVLYLAILPLCSPAIFGYDLREFPSLLVQNREATDCESRGTPGLICTDCTTVQKCVQKSDGKWQTIPVDICDNNLKCNVKEGGCSDKPGPCTSGRDITCHSEGYVPDPYDCQKYHLCAEVDQQSTVKECTGDSAYNAATMKCDQSASKSQFCRDLPVKCEKPGVSGAWLADPEHFYVCSAKVENGEKVIRPEMWRCESGYVYKDAQRGCAKKDEGPGNGSGSGSGSGSGGSGSGGIPDVCTELGKWPDPRDEDRYYVCRKIGDKPKRRSCDWGETFDPVKLKCVCFGMWCW